MKIILTITLLFYVLFSSEAQHRIPASYTNIYYDESGRLYFEKDKLKFYADTSGPRYTINRLMGNPTGTYDGLTFDFGGLNGRLTFGLIPYGKAIHPLPVFRSSVPVRNGLASVSVGQYFRYPYDFVGWEENKGFTLGYRLTDDNGMILFDGEVSVEGTGPFKVVPTIYEGPFISNVTDTSAVIWYGTSMPVVSSLSVNQEILEDQNPVMHHEFVITGLSPSKKYDYTIKVASHTQTYHFTTAPKQGSRKPFIFAYTSDSRHATGSGERMIYGTNAYIMKKMAALSYQQGAAFIQFTGDMINGYLNTREEQLLQYYNWKKSLEPFWHYMPVYTGLGNHEALGYIFKDEKGLQKVFIDKFPYETQSAESVFGEAFVNPDNGPAGEDGSPYDPDPGQVDFPSYKENVYYYTYGNVAIIVLNSDYWFAPTISRESTSGGGLHGYLMDNQIAWLHSTVKNLENNRLIDHIFVTQHTPVFPNGGHSRDDMWYSGNNEMRPYIAGKPVEKGIIERRDEYLDILINQSTKVIAILTGDEHNYNYLKLTQDVPIYPENYNFKKLHVSRPVYQINNGASGAPYYGQEKLPWSAFTRSFSVENAVCLFYVNGKKITMKVLNPDTLNQIDEVKLR
jgi:hypothetical protein